MDQLCGLALLEGGMGCGCLWGNYVADLVGYLWLILFSYGFDAGCNEKFAFIFNLLLLLFVPIYIKI